jgi:hypothetical protein
MVKGMNGLTRILKTGRKEETEQLEGIFLKEVFIAEKAEA